MNIGKEYRLSVLSLNPATKDGLKNVTSLGVMANIVSYFLVFFFPDLTRLPQSVMLGSLTIAMLILLRVLLFAADPLETMSSPWPPEPRFFQAHYPSKFLLKMCNACTDHSRCQDRPLTDSSREYVALWYENFDSLKENNRDLWHRTYEKGFTCRFVFYMKYSFLIFFVVGLITLLVMFLNTALTSSLNQDVSSISTLQYTYIIGNLVLYLVIFILNRPDMKRPTGCWAMWRDISERHVLRLNRNFFDLKIQVCDRHPTLEVNSGKSVKAPKKDTDVRHIS